MKQLSWIGAGTLIIIVVAGYTAFHGRSVAAIATDTIKIGSILPITGDAAFFGNEILRSEEIAIEEARKNNPNITFISEDDRLDAKTAVSAVNKLLSVDKTDGIVTATVQEVKPVATSFGSGSTPLLAEWDSNDYIKTAGNNIFTIGFSTEAGGELMATYAYNTLGLRKIAVISALDDWSAIVSSAFVKKYTALGGTIVFNEQVQPSQKEFRDQLTKIKALGADGLYAPLLPTMMGPLFKEGRQLGLKTMFMTGDSFSADEIGPADGAAEGVYFTNLYADDTKKLDAAYLAKYGQTPQASVFVSLGYDGIRTMLVAIHIAKSKSISVSDAMRQVNIPGTDHQINMNGGQYSEKFEKVYRVKGTDFVEVK